MLALELEVATTMEAEHRKVGGLFRRGEEHAVLAKTEEFGSVGAVRRNLGDKGDRKREEVVKIDVCDILL